MDISGFLMRRRLMSSGDPITFTYHDYIQCDDTSKTSYILLDLFPNRSNDWVFEGSFARTAAIPSDYSMRGIFTRYLAGDYASNYYLGYKAKNQATLVFNYNSRANCESYTGVASTSIAIGEWHTFRLEGDSSITYGGKCTLDSGSPVTYNYGSRPNSNTTQELRLIAGYPCRLGRFKIYYQESLVADLIPATRDTDDLVGMYDVVRGRFFTPTGNATFVCGDGMSNFNV